MAGEKTLEEERGLKEFLEHVDKVLEKAKGVYDLGEKCSVYFSVYEYYVILGELEKELVEAELGERDAGTPEIKWWKGFLYSVKINNPWG